MPYWSIRTSRSNAKDRLPSLKSAPSPLPVNWRKLRYPVFDDTMNSMSTDSRYSPYRIAITIPPPKKQACSLSRSQSRARPTTVTAFIQAPIVTDGSPFSILYQVMRDIPTASAATVALSSSFFRCARIRVPRARKWRAVFVAIFGFFAGVMFLITYILIYIYQE